MPPGGDRRTPDWQSGLFRMNTALAGRGRVRRAITVVCSADGHVVHNFFDDDWGDDAGTSLDVFARVARLAPSVLAVEYRPVRVAVGSRDEAEAAGMKAELEAKLFLGIETHSGEEKPAGADMAWDDFREQYRALHLATVRDSITVHAESRLDLAERILKPKTLADVADPNALQRFQARLRVGEQSRRKKPRSAPTVRGYMNSVLSAMNRAYLQGWLPVAPKLRNIRNPRQNVMKGWPITADEFQKMLDVTAKVVGEDAAASWKHVLRGL